MFYLLHCCDWMKQLLTINIFVTFEWSIIWSSLNFISTQRTKHDRNKNMWGNTKIASKPKISTDIHAQGRLQMKCQNHMKSTLSALRFSFISINSQLIASLKATSQSVLCYSLLQNTVCKMMFESHTKNVPKRKLLRL